MIEKSVLILFWRGYLIIPSKIDGPRIFDEITVDEE
jgi:hypothetical protein